MSVRIGIYNEPAEGGIGGAEVSVAVLAEALARDNRVDIVHHKQELTRERLAEISGTDLSDVRMRCVVAEPYAFGSTHNPLRRYSEAREWRQALSEPYELFINFTHGFPPFCHARRGALIVLFPFHEAPHSRHREQNAFGNSIRDALTFAYHDWEWKKRLASYDIKSAISRFSRTWATRRWGIDCEVIYPPVDTHLDPREKQDIILSVGRFTASGHSKKQLEMMTTFGELQKSGRHQWEYFSIGGVSDALKDREYFERVARIAGKGRMHALANLERRRVQQLYQRARVFWHAAGYGEDERRPELSEHFGIATVEAMSAGCVPVVIDKGGQPEIVEHGVSGFLWSTLEELKRYTELLMRDDELRAQMAKAARARAAFFSREHFVHRFSGLLGKLT